MHLSSSKIVAVWFFSIHALSLMGCNDKLPNFKVIELPSKVDISSNSECSAIQHSVSREFGAPIAGAVAKSNIIFVVDTSGSMGDELIKLQVSLPQFINQLTSRLDSNHKIVLHAQASGWALPGVYVHDRYVGSTDKMSKIEQALGASATSSSRNMIPRSALFTDPGSIFHYVIVTDDVEEYGSCQPVWMGVQSMAPYSASSVSGYESCLVDRYQAGVGAYMSARGFSHRLHAIHFKGGSSVPGASVPLGCAVGTAAGTSLSETGAPYVSLSRAFGGGSHDLCQDSWSELMEGLVDEISSAAQSHKVELSACPGKSVSIQRVVIRQGGYSRVLQMNDAGALLLHQAASGSPASVQIQNAFLQQLIQSGEMDGAKGYSLHVDYSVI